jgi:Arc/MetJ-type ribon-helix-helix transcriptional regulator
LDLDVTLAIALTLALALGIGERYSGPDRPDAGTHNGDDRACDDDAHGGDEEPPKRGPAARRGADMTHILIVERRVRGLKNRASGTSRSEVGYTFTMTISLSSELKKYVEEQVRAGRFASPKEVVEAGLARLMPDAPPEALDVEDLAAIDESEAQIARREDFDFAQVSAKLRQKYLGTLQRS